MSENKEEPMAATNIPLVEELQQQIERVAREQNREPAEVLEDAVRRYLGNQKLERFAEKAGQVARRKRIREQDIPRLVQEVRRENETRER